MFSYLTFGGYDETTQLLKCEPSYISENYKPLCHRALDGIIKLLLRENVDLVLAALEAITNNVSAIQLEKN